MTDQKPKGGLRFSTEVLETIAGIAANEVDGILAMSGGIVEGFTERLGRKNLTKGVTVEMGGDGSSRRSQGGGPIRPQRSGNL